MPDAFAKYNEGSVKCASLGASHLNNSLGGAHQGVPNDMPEVSENGRLSTSVLEKQEAYKQALHRGLNWKVVRWPVEVLFPDLPSMFQAALHARVQSQSGII